MGLCIYSSCRLHNGRFYIFYYWTTMPDNKNYTSCNYQTKQFHCLTTPHNPSPTTPPGTRPQGAPLWGVVVQLNCLVWPTRGPPLKGPGGACGVLSDSGIIWFGSYNLYNFCCPRVTHKPLPHNPSGDPEGGAPCGPQLFHHPLSNTTFFSGQL